MILLATAAEQATHRLGMEELAWKQTGSRTVRCVQGQNFIRTQARRQEGAGKEWTRGNKPSPYRWIHLWELRPETPVKTVNPPAPLRVQGTTTKNFGKGSRLGAELELRRPGSSLGPSQ